MRRSRAGGLGHGQRRQRGRGRLLDLLLALAILGLLSLLAAKLDRMAAESHAGVPFVVDGDTLQLGEVRIRLHGMDAPELQQTCRKDGADYPCGRHARDALSRLVGAGVVVCSGRQRDQYRRLLGSCLAGEVDVNRRMVADGHAVAFGDFEHEQEAARRNGAGLWAGSFEEPRSWRARHGAPAESEHPGTSSILGRLLHLFGLP